MNLLLDTHILLWWLDDHTALTNEAKRSIEHPHNLIVISTVTLWEVALKASLGKIDIPTDFEAVLDREPFEQLAIKPSHAHVIALFLRGEAEVCAKCGERYFHATTLDQKDPFHRHAQVELSSGPTSCDRRARALT